MKRSFLLGQKGYLLWVLSLLLLCTACVDEQIDNPVEKDGLAGVSQYASREFDGVKRADIFYEIFIRSFADSNGDGVGDLRGITEKLDYLDGLGVKGIWITPMFPSHSYHGYDVLDYEAIHPVFGTLEDFDELIAEAHRRDIRVVLDFVMNHTSREHPWFQAACQADTSQYRSYFIFSENPQVDIRDGKIDMIATEGASGYDGGQWFSVPHGTTSFKYHSHFWTDWFADINYGAVETAEQSDAYKAMIKAAKFWIDRGVDGFRLDAVKHIYHNATSDENPKFLRKFYDELAAYFTSKSYFSEPLYMIGEMLSEHNEVAPYYKGLPAMFDFSSWYRLEYAIKNSHAKWFPKDMINYQREYAAVRSNFISGTKLSNHDESRTRSVLGGSYAVSAERSKMACAVLLTTVGSPYIYYGEEIGMLGRKDGGDENVREPMLWDAIGSDSYRTGKYPVTKNSTEELVGTVRSQWSDEKSIYNTYRYFTRLRNTYPALAKGTLELPADFKDWDNNNKQVMVFIREYASERLLVIHNVSENSSTYEFTASKMTPVGDMNRVNVVEKGENVYVAELPPYSSIVIEI